MANRVLWIGAGLLIVACGGGTSELGEIGESGLGGAGATAGSQGETSGGTGGEAVGGSSTGGDDAAGGSGASEGAGAFGAGAFGSALATGGQMGGVGGRDAVGGALVGGNNSGLGGNGARNGFGGGFDFGGAGGDDCQSCDPPPSDDCIGLGRCGCGPYLCGDEECVKGTCRGMCVGTACGGVWECVDSVVCTTDEIEWCGCDGKTFWAPSSCPVQAYSSVGECD